MNRIALALLLLSLAACRDGGSGSTDADGDTITDADEAREASRDADGDGTPDWQDLDSDDDCRGDAIEAGDASLATAPIDTDGDGAPDVVDVDSDADRLADETEDPDCDGAVGLPETSAVAADTDGDGASDLVELAIGTDPRDGGVAPADPIVVAPFAEPAEPSSLVVNVPLAISAFDFFVLMDTTGSMGGELTNLKNSLSSTIIPELRSLPDAAVGVGSYEDFPTMPYGAAGDVPFALNHRVMTISSAAGVTSVQTAVNGLALGNGSDVPEAGWQALHEVATGAGLSAGGANVPAFNPMTAFPSTPPAGSRVGTVPGVGFREGAARVVFLITDASHHPSYSFAGATVTTAALADISAAGLRVMSLVSNDADFVAAEADALLAANVTGTVVSTAAFGIEGVDRPVGCPAAQCCTGINGVGRAPDGDGRCPLVQVCDSAGTGLGISAIRSTKALLSEARYDVRPTLRDDAADTIDATGFVLSLAPSASGPCASSTIEGDAFASAQVGTTACFTLTTTTNGAVAAGSTPAAHRAFVRTRGDHVTDLGETAVWFVVPPALPVLDL